MSEIPQTKTLASNDLSLLAYAQYMAKTAQSDAAKRMFEAYVRQEKLRLEANGGFHLSAMGDQGSRTEHPHRRPHITD